jgi:2-haloacid dehalogenase
MNRRQWLHLTSLAGAAGLPWLSGCGGGPPSPKTVVPVESDRAGAAHGALEVLLFDVFGTVVEWRASLTSQFQQFARARGLEADWQALATRWQAAYLPSLEDVRNNRRAFVGLETLRRESLDRLLPSFGLAGLSDADRDVLVRCWGRLEPWPDTVAGLSRLKRRFAVVAFSNGGFRLLLDMARHAQLPWDAILSAEMFRRFKPDPAIYREAVKLLACPAAAILLVAAHNIDLAAGQASGMRTAYVQRSTEDARPTGDWNFVARDFDDLAQQLGA